MHEKESVVLTYKEAGQILGKLLEIHPDKTATFLARLQQLQKLGLPPGSNVGRGSRFAYTLNRVAEMAIYLDLLDVGLTPKTIAEEFGGERPIVSDEVWAEAFQTDRTDEGPYYSFYVNALWPLRSPDDERPGNWMAILSTVPKAAPNGPSVCIPVGKRARAIAALARDLCPDKFPKA